MIAPTAMHIGFVQGLMRPEIEIAAQNIWKVNVWLILVEIMNRDMVPTLVSSLLLC